MCETNSSTNSTVTSDSQLVDLMALIGRIATQDQDALARLYDTTKRQVFGLLLRILGDEGSAEEVMMDVYMQVWRRAGQYDQSRGAPQAWLTTIARSRAIDRLRSGKHEVKLKEPLDPSVVAAESSDGKDMALDSDRRKVVGRALDLLPAEQRSVIELAYFQGLSQAEIAIHLSQPLGTVKTRTRLGMAKLRENLQPLMEGAF